MSTGVHLDDAEVDGLRRRVPSLSVQPSPGRRQAYDLRPGSQVGIVRLGELTVEIRPKLPVRRLLFLLSYVLDPKGWQHDDVEVDAAANLFEAVIPAFARLVRRALRRGVLQGYRSEDEALPLVRGRVRFDEQIRHRYGRLPPVEVRYDLFTEDIEANRLIKAAAARLRRLRPRSLAARRSLAVIDGALAGVADVAYRPSDVPMVHYDRLNAHYRPAVELSRLILRSASFDLEQGDVRSVAFLIDMNAVFEDFVVTALREALGLSTTAFPQGASGRWLWLDQAHRVRLEPDVSWWEAGRPVIVGDVKYKWTADALGRNADIYQSVAYAVAADLPGALLIYAAGERDQAVHQIVHLDKAIEVVTMDLDGEPAAVLERVAGIAACIRRWRDRVGPGEDEDRLRYGTPRDAVGARRFGERVGA